MNGNQLKFQLNVSFVVPMTGLGWRQVEAV
jgi:hypothetical protein